MQTHHHNSPRTSSPRFQIRAPPQRATEGAQRVTARRKRAAGTPGKCSRVGARRRVKDSGALRSLKTQLARRSIPPGSVRLCTGQIVASAVGTAQPHIRAWPFRAVPHPGDFWELQPELSVRTRGCASQGPRVSRPPIASELPRGEGRGRVLEREAPECVDAEAECG